jgi:hypothetical protein
MPWGSERAFAFALVSLAIGLRSADARADEFVEPSYGRVQGDVMVGAGLGGTIASGGPRASAELRVRYLESAGIYGTYEEGPALGLSSNPRRVVATGLELRPLFLYRWLQGKEMQRERVDLLIDSFGLEMGLAWAQPEDGSFPTHPGFEAGLGLEMPITLGATGLWLALHGGLRWSAAAMSSGVVDTSNDRQAYLTITVAWHQVVVSHLVDVGDTAPR